MVRKVLYLTTDTEEIDSFSRELKNDLEVQGFDNPSHFLTWLSKGEAFDAIIFSLVNPSSQLGLNLIKAIKKDLSVQKPVFWVSDAPVSPALQTLLLNAGVSDIFERATVRGKLLTRLRYFSIQIEEPVLDIKKNAGTYRNRTGKRFFDIVFSLTALICLLPLFLVVALLIKMESKGPVFYYSYRVGTGYRIFKFWKFRSMRQDAEHLLNSIKELNQYQSSSGQTYNLENTLCDTCAAAGNGCQNELVDMKGQMICEKQFQQARKMQLGSAFIKISNDPRVTRIGLFLRNTSIDELPQLFNVLRGDMSIVGNRPLPLYEAEKITTDQFAARFVAPAGITGLWQISKRGKKDMSEDERKALDIEYAQTYSLFKDLQIILKTLPALFQKENV
ncbi:sugar transferase [Pontibacter pamirensis]|uniref:sugar transferase n=1 Tax=Pontibacter pamirensis TaxID=2562824 RepID=UPI001389CA51|nr:sugar transferase [Pontibacter pamirensis]